MFDLPYFLIGSVIGIAIATVTMLWEELRRYDIVIDGNKFKNVSCTFHFFSPEIEVFIPEINRTVHFRYSWYYIQRSYWKRKKKKRCE